MTLIVGKKTDTGVCRIETTSEDVDEPRYVEFQLPSETAALKSGAPKWANYVKGVVACYDGKVNPVF